MTDDSTDDRTWRSTLAAQVVQYRRRHALSRRALARQLGLPHSTVTRIELGEHEPRVSTLCLLADTLGTELSLQIRPGEPARLREPGSGRVQR